MIKVAIRRNSDGEVRVHTDEDSKDWEDGKWSWTEGNYGCDCNRHLWFERAAGGQPELDSVTCGEDKYSLAYVELEDGTRVQLGWWERGW